MQDVIAVLREQRDRLMADVERIDTAISALSGSSGSSRSPRSSRRSAPVKPAVGGAGRKRRKMSAAAKKAVSERMKNYWAERKKQQTSGANA